ncbi:MAG TPA: tRNA (guanosine(37)-N1)-methyltransferase TrmD [Candidatus Gallimonas gallistercoris]|uniref:tRNA (guanine-N(1)-)-methyltransferase n=1 Tax=Candidatus Gallimonas gallistercoris TaxID=2838602 RepID=A0A9D2H288_9FIRM|nr:tRNA (guanosine(37)-N1)-methyltransferase TrmD [Candidatus Gallimonas gallistercoris]
MKITILTLFPEMFTALSQSILGRALKSGKFSVDIVDIRDYTEDKHLKCDDYPFGGGAGMVMMAQPIGSAIEAVDPDHKARRIYLSPKGKTFRQEKVFELVEEEHLVLLCGHYEGVDQRAIDLFIDEEISICDYVLTGGELPAMVVVDCVARYVEGVLSPESLVQESFSENLLEYPQYTRPVEYRGLTVPEVLRSGNHAEIDKWRRAQAEAVTRKMRPDLLK